MPYDRTTTIGALVWTGCNRHDPCAPMPATGAMHVRNWEMTMHRVKSFGYLVSTISVVLLAIVSWSKAREEPLLMACLIGGVAASIIGMFCRWLSYEVEERRKASGKSIA